MELIEITYGDSKYERAKQLNLSSARRNGKVNKAISYCDRDLDSEFINRNSGILNQKRGAGYWLWKPYIILDALKKMNDNDYLIYSDAAICYVKSVSKLVRCMEKENCVIMPFSLGKYLERKWTKRDVFLAINADSNEVCNTPQIWAGFIVMKKCEFTLQFVEEWMTLAENEQLLTDSPSLAENYPDFIENRHDQSIYSVLVKKYKLKVFRDPSQYGELRRNYFDDDVIRRSTFPQVIDAHRWSEANSLLNIKIRRIKLWIKKCLKARRFILYNNQFR